MSVAASAHPRPAILLPTDAIVRMTKTTICGTDLHILRGEVPTCEPGRVLGHEGVGVVVEVGAAVTTVGVGAKVVISSVTSCGRCRYCRRSMFSHCVDGGWLLGNRIDGTQAQYVRVPHADTSMYSFAGDLEDDTMTMISHVLPTGFERGVQGNVRPGGIVAIVGAGPVGLAALLTARLFSPADIFMIDVDYNRLEIAKSLGATATIDNTDGSARDAVMRRAGNRGVDVAIEAVGTPKTFELCQGIVAPGGVIANIGVHGVNVEYDLEHLEDRAISITTGLVDTWSIPALIRLVRARKLDPSRLISHHFKLDQIAAAYETFRNAANTMAIKVIVEA